jgi:predicted nuclease of predicted toxin-antitoxin system
LSKTNSKLDIFTIWKNHLGQQWVEDFGLRHAEDQEVWMHALNFSTVLITKDQDFAERAARDPNVPRIVWIRVGNTTNPALVQWLAPRLQNVGHCPKDSFGEADRLSATW